MCGACIGVIVYHSTRQVGLLHIAVDEEDGLQPARVSILARADCVHNLAAAATEDPLKLWGVWAAARLRSRAVRESVRMLAWRVRSVPQGACAGLGGG